MFDVNLWTVFLMATLTAVATGLGALPFLVLRKISDHWMAIFNAIAAGLMLAASHSLVAEGIELSAARTLLGLALGLIAIFISHRLITNGKTPEIADLTGLNAGRAMLVVGIMTAHSFAEGIGVGVSFGGGEELGTYISSAIAIHNIPEGLAIALILVPLGTPVWKAALWGIFSSLPQPLMAIPSYMFVETFEPLLPIGFGIAAGAMIWMVFAELIPEATEDAPGTDVGTAVTAAFIAMLAFQYLVLQ